MSATSATLRAIGPGTMELDLRGYDAFDGIGFVGLGVRGAKPRNSAKMGRHPNRAGGIAPQSRGNDPCRDRRSRSPARPARNARKVIRVLHVAEGRIGAGAP